MSVLRADLSESPIDVASHEALVDHSAAGAVVSFAGVVRNHDGGRRDEDGQFHPSARKVKPRPPRRSRSAAQDCNRKRRSST